MNCLFNPNSHCIYSATSPCDLNKFNCWLESGCIIILNPWSCFWVNIQLGKQLLLNFCYGNWWVLLDQPRAFRLPYKKYPCLSLPLHDKCSRMIRVIYAISFTSLVWGFDRKIIFFTNVMVAVKGNLLRTMLIDTLIIISKTSCLITARIHNIVLYAVYYV